MSKFILVTGAAGGIGNAVCTKLHESGFQLIAVVRTEKQAQELRGQFAEKNIICLVGDIVSSDFVDECQSRLLDIAKDNRIYGVVNCAGIANPAPILEQPISEIKEVFDVNFFAPLCFIKMVVPIFKKQKEGCIINISSIEGHVTFPFVAAYSATKHAIEAITSAFRIELRGENIKVASIVPGFINTPIWDKAEQRSIEKFSSSSLYEVFKKAKRKFITIGRNGLSPEKVAAVAVSVVQNKKTKPHYIVVQNYFFEWFLMRILPVKLVDWVIAKYVGIK